MIYSSTRFLIGPLISVPGGRFPRARLQPPRHCVPAGSSARAVPAGVAALHSNQLLPINRKVMSVTSYYKSHLNAFCSLQKIRYYHF